MPGRSLYWPAVNSFSDCQRERHMWPTSGFASAITNRDPSLGEVVTHRQPGLAPADDQDVDPLGNDRVGFSHASNVAGGDSSVGPVRNAAANP